MIAPNKVILFGSRARGDAKRYSDFDVAFEFPKENESKWGAFCVEAQEELPTLLSFDLINLREASRELLSSITKEGIILYEHKTH